MTDLLDHLEQTLGPVQVGWSKDSDGVELPFHVVSFARSSDDHSVAYATLGLSRHTLTSPISGRRIRQELLMLAPESQESSQVVRLLVQVGEMALGSHRALLRGNVVGPAGPLVPESELTALYVTMPVYFPNEFATCPSPDGDIVISWLVPITTNEANFIAATGWGAFEERLVEENPDLGDFRRAAITL